MITAEVLDIPANEYHASDRLSNSRLSVFLEDPALYEGRFITGEFPDERKAAYDFGTVVHDAILMGGAECVVKEIPDGVLTSSGAKSGNAWKQFAAEHAGKFLLKSHEAAAVRRAIDSVWQHPKAKKLLQFDGGRNEASLFWTCEETGLELRARLDRITPAFIADLKTTTSTDPRRFAAAMVEYGYHRQAAFYRDGAAAVGFGSLAVVFIAVKKEPPYSVETYVPDAAFVDAGAAEIRQGLRDFAECKASGVWKRKKWGELVVLDAPKWLVNR